MPTNNNASFQKPYKSDDQAKTLDLKILSYLGAHGKTCNTANYTDMLKFLRSTIFCLRETNRLSDQNHFFLIIRVYVGVSEIIDERC